MNGHLQVDQIPSKTTSFRITIKAWQRLFLAFSFLTLIIIACGSFGLWLSSAIQDSEEALQSINAWEYQQTDPTAVQAAVLNQAERMARLGSLAHLFSISAIVVGIAFSFLAYRIIRRTVHFRLTHLIRIVEEIPSGSLSSDQSPFSIEPQQDEIGQLSHALRRMYDWMQDSFNRFEREIEARSASLQRRSVQLNVAAQFASEIAAAHDLDTLLHQTVTIIRDHFGFYHAGVFLIDSAEEFAVLRAANGEVGRLMVAQGHRLKVGEVGVVGRVAKSGEPRIASNVDGDSAHFINPLLPETRSEAALPLKSAGRVIGVLDVQSQHAFAFDEESLSTFQIMADQLAIAIQNTRLFQESQENYARLEMTFREVNRQAWARMLQTSRLCGYEFDGMKSQPIHLGDLSTNGSDSIDGRASLQAPLHLRGEKIGEINIWSGEEELSEDDMEFISMVCDRLSQSLESARLYEDAQRQAWREQQINLITSEARTSINLETILQNTVREIGKSLRTQRAFIQIGGCAFGEEWSGIDTSAQTQATSIIKNEKNRKFDVDCSFDEHHRRSGETIL